MNYIWWFHILERISVSSSFIPLFICLIRFKVSNTEIKILFIYIFVSVLSEVFSLILAEQYIKNNIVWNMFTVLECTLIARIYFLRSEVEKSRRIITFFYFLFLLLAFATLILKKGFNLPQSILSIYESWFFIILSYSYFFKMVRELNVDRLTDYYFAWINSAILIYFCMSFFLFLFDWYLEQSDLATYSILYTPHLLVNIAYNILLSIGIWKFKHR